LKKNLTQKLKKIKLLIMDVDGVLTKGEIVYDHRGQEIKFFNVYDGFAIVLFRKAGFKTAILSARACEAVRFRGEDLKVDRIVQDAQPKLKAYKQILKELKIEEEEACFVADDLMDLGVFQRVGVAVAVANAAVEVKKLADHVTTKEGGEGAVREVIELILKAKGKWRGIVASFMQS
jgi:3-deoxy-D-manno-octulosonate 8-phosphate phosphatase (KDO 8-P phosphatase)